MAPRWYHPQRLSAIGQGLDDLERLYQFKRCTIRATEADRGPNGKSRKTKTADDARRVHTNSPCARLCQYTCGVLSSLPE
eukprot:3784816-Amphidinium_carterae.1